MKNFIVHSLIVYSLFLTSQLFDVLGFSVLPLQNVGFRNSNISIDNYRKKTSYNTSNVRSSIHYLKWFNTDESTKVSKNIATGKQRSATPEITIKDHVGSGSYGTVHLCQFITSSNNQDDNNFYIAKRAWTLNDIKEQDKVKRKKSDIATTEVTNRQEDEDTFVDRAKRCSYYLDVEQHCLQKLLDCNDGNAPYHVPKLVGRFTDDSNERHEWMVVELVTRSNEKDFDLNKISDPESAFKYNVVAKSLKEAIDVDWVIQHNSGSSDSEELNDFHHLSIVQREMNLPVDATFDDTLDEIMTGLLDMVCTIHKCNIVHRDIKPQNILLSGKNKGFVLIDFGSAADIDPQKTSFWGGTRIGLEDDSRVAVSPIYAAPEIFIKKEREPLAFDVYSTAMIFCQLLFNLLDERAEASFRQQLMDAQFDLDIWLERELISTIQPAGLDDGLLYLGSRPGLWKLLKGMLQPNPNDRVSSTIAKKTFKQILIDAKNENSVLTRENLDGAYFDSVIKSLESCNIMEGVGEAVDDMSATSILTQKTIPRPLHFVATFDRYESLGLILSEKETDDIEELDERSKMLWGKATEGCLPGEVFVRGVVPGGQADRMDIFDIGDRVIGVNEFPIVGKGGFEYVVDMLSKTPKNLNTVKVHFDRRPRIKEYPKESYLPHEIKVTSQGAWSTKGKRQTQEDRFVLHEIHDEKGLTILMAGVFDGHGGDAASTTASQLLPSLFTEEARMRNSLKESLISAWDSVCDTYRNSCSIFGACVADYNPSEGIIVASTGATDLIAGTTAVAAVWQSSKDELVIMNCGDSRALLVGLPSESGTGQGEHSSVIHFATRDHSLSDPFEANRLYVGREKGLDYSLPQCSVNRWWIKVGDYQYAVARSLEGEFTTSKGIISNADATTLSLTSLFKERTLGCLVIASDGLFEVLDNEQVGREVLRMREKGLSAKDTAKMLCKIAVEKDTSDNVTVVVVFFE